jgi:DNA-binding response OmpR family regulator
MLKDKLQAEIPSSVAHFDRNGIARDSGVTPIVIYYAAQAQSSHSLGFKCVEEIKSLGFQVDICADSAELLRTADYCRTEEIMAIFLLSGSVIEICSLAMSLRAHQLQHAIVALMDTNSDMALTQVLQSGVDNYCDESSQIGLLAAILLRLQARFYRRTFLEQSEDVTPRWRLAEQDWVLVSPEGIRIRLTTNERCFMKILLGSPDLRVTHEQLTMAMGAHRSIESTQALRPGKLGVMISRLRMKFNEHGLVCPLKSLHNWGYMFTGVV